MKESDWKIFTRLKEEALQEFCRTVLKDMGTMISESKKSPHETYLAAYKLITSRDKKIALLFDDHRRSIARLQLINLRKHGLIDDEQIAEFSEELQKSIN